MMTIGQKLDLNRGVGPGFDFLRVFLAVSVVALHSYWVVGIDADAPRSLWFEAYSVIPMFFALSGFLIAGSAQRLNLRDFLINRGLRIIPALAVEILGSAFILGAVFTTLPLNKYFSSANTWHYLTNILGVINYWLPGVFTNLPATQVNISLWTIPLEISCYALMVFFIGSSMIKRPKAIVIAVIVYGCVGVGGEILLHVIPANTTWADVLLYLFIGRGPKLLLFFMAGIAAYLLRYKLPYHLSGLLFAVTWCVATALIAPVRWLDTPMLNALTCIPIVYIMAFIGVSNISKLPLYHRGDYSYGIYLYGFPIQQAVKTLFPAITNPWQITLIAVPAISIFAAFSWHYVEKPILRLRKNFSFIAKTRLVSEGTANRAHAAPTPLTTEKVS